MATHTPTKPLAKLPPAERARRIAILVRNPGTRASVPTNLLPANYRRMRETNTRLRQPIVPGSTLTNRDLARETDAAATEKYGPAESQATQAITASQQRERDVAGYYDTYLADLAKHRDNVTQIQGQAAQQLDGLGNVTGPADAAPQDAGNQEIAGKAAAIRQALLGAMKGELVAGGRAASTYADTLANVVGPGQKLGAVTRAGENTTTARSALGEIAREKGAFRTTYGAQAKADETKNVLSAQALGLDAAKVAQTSADKAADRTARTQATSDKLITSGTFAGFTNAQVRAMTPEEKTQLRGASKTPEKVITSGPFAGHTQSEIARHSQKWIQARLDAAEAGKPSDAASKYAKDFYDKFGVKPASTGAVSNAQSEIQKAASYVHELVADGWSRQDIGQQLLQGGKVQVGVKQDANGKPIKDSRGNVVPVYKSYPKIKGLWLTSALDQQFLKGVSNATADRLHRSGYSVKQLGLSSATAKPDISQGTGNPSSSTGTGLG